MIPLNHSEMRPRRDMGVLECQHLKQEEVVMELGGAGNGQRIKLSLCGVRHGWVGEEMGMRGKDG